MINLLMLIVEVAFLTLRMRPLSSIFRMRFDNRSSAAWIGALTCSLLNLDVEGPIGATALRPEQVPRSVSELRDPGSASGVKGEIGTVLARGPHVGEYRSVAGPPSSPS